MQLYLDHTLKSKTFFMQTRVYIRNNEKSMKYFF